MKGGRGPSCHSVTQTYNGYCSFATEKPVIELKLQFCDKVEPSQHAEEQAFAKKIEP
jgi:hypothetical protein